MPDSPPPAYSQFDDDPFVDNPPAPALPQSYGTQPRPIDYRALHGYGPEIPAPEDMVRPDGPLVQGKWYTVSAGTEILITGSWAIAAARAVGVPGGIYKSQPTWKKAIEYYTACYRDGSVKILEPRDSSATPGRSVSTAVTVHSGAPTPTRGTRIMPIHVASSPITNPVMSTPRAHNCTTNTAPSTPVAGNRTFPISITSSPIAAPVIKKDYNEQVFHKSIDRAFAKLSQKNTAGPSQHAASYRAPSEPAAWLDPTPVSIPRARTITRSVTPPVADGRDVTTPSTPIKTGKGKEASNSDSDDEYFCNEADFTDAELEAMFEWEQTFELQEALSSPRFN